MNPLFFPKSSSSIQLTDLDQFRKENNSKKLEKFVQIIVKNNATPRFANQYCYLQFLGILKERQNDFIDRTLYTKVLSVFGENVNAPKEPSKLDVRIEGKDGTHCTIPKEALESFDYFKTMLGSTLKESKTDQDVYRITCRLPSGEPLSSQALECFKGYVFNGKIATSDIAIMQELHEWAHLLNDTNFQETTSKCIIEYLSDEEHVQEFDKLYVEGLSDAFVDRYLQKRGLDSSDMSVINFLHLTEKNSPSPALEFVMDRMEMLHFTAIGPQTIAKLQLVPKKIRKCIQYLSNKEPFLVPTFNQLELLLDLFPNAAYTKSFLDVVMKDSLKKLKAEDYTGFCHFLAAEYFLANKSADQAWDSLNKALEIGPENAFVLRGLGEFSFRKKELDEAKSYLKKSLRINPKNSRSLGVLGAVQRMQGDLEEAKKNLHEAVRLNPRNIRAFANLGDVLRQQGQLVQAAQIFNEVLKVDSNDVLALSGLGDVLREQGKLPQAEENFNRALRIDSKNVIALSGLGDVLRMRGDMEGAKQKYSEALRIDPKNILARKWLPSVLCELKKFKEVLEIDPENVVALSGFATILRGEGKVEESEKYYRKALEIDPENNEVRKDLSSVLQRQNKFREAVEVNPENFSALWCLGKAMREEGKLEEAEKNYRQALKLTPQNYSDDRKTLNNVLQQLQKLKDDKKNFYELLKHNSQDDRALSGLGDVLRQGGQLEDAKEQFMKALEINSKNVVALSGLGDVLRQGGQLEDAKKKFKEALEIDPKNVVAHGGLADVLFQQGHIDEARQHYVKAYRIDRYHIVMNKCKLWPVEWF
jgi:tetratricopeptide (TPR) repeat protein